MLPPIADCPNGPAVVDDGSIVSMMPMPRTGLIAASAYPGQRFLLFMVRVKLQAKIFIGLGRRNYPQQRPSAIAVHWICW
jgi:hypothetical protein